MFLFLYIWLIYLETIFLRYLIICASYITALIALGIDTGISNPFIAKIINDNNSATIVKNDPALIALTFVYSALSILIIFSIQKTGHKNSIIPS